MSSLLLDTHVALWWLAEQPLTLVASVAIADPENDARVSIASLWELAIKHSVGRFRLQEDLAEVLTSQGFDLLGIEAPHVRAVADLPLHHRDPFDRMLVAQAQVERPTLVTRDQRLADYDVATLAA